MLQFIRHLIWILGNAVLSLRYRVHVTGLESVKGMKHALILPNHPAYTDPPLVLKTVWPTLKPRPMLLASMFRNPLIFWLPALLDAVEIPDLHEASAEAREQAEKSLQTVIAGLREGRNHILWPSGRVYRTAGRESLGAARSLSEILQAVPEAQIIVVRTRGLWGSMFSYAKTGKQPNLALCLIKGVGILLSNLLVLSPRRKVEMTIEHIDRSRLPGLAREKLNPFLDAWYNAPGEEVPKYVPYHFLLGPRTYVYPKLGGGEGVNLEQIKPTTRETVAHMVAEKLKREPEASEFEPGNKLEDLGLDSLDRMELLLDIERRFGFSADDVPATIGGLWALAEGQVKAREVRPVPKEWFRLPTEKDRLGILHGTMAKAFVDRCIHSGGSIAAVDDVSGLVSYRMLLVSAGLLSRRFAALEGANIGVLLPASVASMSVYFALQVAGKLPVMLNWTTGSGNLAHAAQVMNLRYVITSRKFVDRTGVQVAGTKYVFLEDLRGGIKTMEKVGALLRVRLMPSSILKRLPNQKPDDPAVVLFTSGSEKAPKAVPLTHRNILSNIEAALKAFHLDTHDSLMAFLPTFHSFGLTVTTVLPALTGARVAYHPDPTDAASIARKTAMYKTTIMLGTPTFISLIMSRARDHELDSLRLAVVGAEKCPPSLFEAAKEVASQAVLIEGYGITECSPIVAANPVEKSKPGSVGLPLPNVKVKVADVETHAPLPQSEVGMLLISGPSVFPGYIGEGGDPFIEQDGVRWYVSGDLARLDEDGYIWLAGRLKRFIKAGGEMISLPAIEEPLAGFFPAGDKGPRVAVEGIETHDGRRIVLFTTEPITLRAANELLQSKGLRGIMRLDEVRKLDALPVLGTGKTDYKVLRAMI